LGRCFTFYTKERKAGGGDRSKKAYRRQVSSLVAGWGDKERTFHVVPKKGGTNEDQGPKSVLNGTDKGELLVYGGRKAYKEEGMNIRACEINPKGMDKV